MLDLTDFPTTVCSCGGDTFKTLVRLDPTDFTIAWYTLTGYCEACGNKVEFPEPRHDLP